MSSSSSSFSLDPAEFLIRLFKYCFEGLVLCFAAYSITSKLDVQEVIILGLIAAATFAVLDLFAPSIGSSVRSGAGYGVGFNLVGFPGAPHL